MAILRSKDIRKLSEKEFVGKVTELEKELVKLRSQSAAGGALESPGKVRAIKRTIARMKTIKQEVTKK